MKAPPTAQGHLTTINTILLLLPQKAVFVVERERGGVVFGSEKERERVREGERETARETARETETETQREREGGGVWK